MARTKFDEKRNKEAQIAKFQSTNNKTPAVEATPPAADAKTAAAPAGKRKKRRRRPKRWASEARRYQGVVPAKKFVPQSTFQRVARELLAEARPDQGFRITKNAMKTLHEVAMSEIGELFTMANDCVVHRKGHTLRVHDMQLINKLVAKLERRFSVAASA